MKWLKFIAVLVYLFLIVVGVNAQTGSSSSYNVTVIENAFGGGSGSSSSFNVSAIVAPAASGSSASFNVSLGYVFSGEEKPQEQPAPQTPAATAPSGGGAGAGGINSPAKFIQSVPEIQANMPVVISVDDLNMAVSEITLTLTETVKNVEVTVAAQDSTTVSIPVATGAYAASQLAVYKYIDISLSSDVDKIKSATINFFVEKSWIASQSVLVDTIKLMHFKNGNWIELPTEKISEDAEKMYFKAQTDSFSLFAIVWKTSAALNVGENCGDNLCQAGESSGTCPADCAKGYESAINQNVYRFSLAAGAISVVILILLIYLHERKSTGQKIVRDTNTDKSSSKQKKKSSRKILRAGWKDRLAKRIIVMAGRSGKK